MPKTTPSTEKTENNFYELLKEMLETQSQTLKEVKELREEFNRNKSASDSDDAWNRM